MDACLENYYKCIEQGLADERPFNPTPYYSAESDTLFYYGRDVPSYAKRINPLATLILATEDASFVGFKVKGIARLIARMEKLGMDRYVLAEQVIDAKRFVELALLMTPNDDAATEQYVDAIVKLGKVPIDRKELPLGEQSVLA